ncbi:MAG TPA: hypothetical protein VH351_07910 [Bryobacteraceae bacterium]|jgi:hypothetical protein|nr:hypothetical protein [Bryobacteraceae bacterium]
MFVNSDSFFIPEEDCIGENVTLSRAVCAIQLVQRSNGLRLGPLTQLRGGTTVELCGEGYNERTVKVRVNGDCFFIFAQDLDVASKAVGA